MEISKEVLEIAFAISRLGGRALIVGGSVRDYILGCDSKDIDIEVYGLAVAPLVDLLKTLGKVDLVGKSFGVIKLTTKEGDYDFSLPRRENKAGAGHKGFQVNPDPSLTVKEAASRRDFTFNSLAYDPLAGEIIDHFGGIAHLRAGFMSATSEAFSEDPLRVLRGFQFAGRFDLVPDLKTIKLCKSLRSEYQHLSLERIWGEWHKWATKSQKPSAGLALLRLCGWIDLYPELKGLIGVNQDPEWHPEGDVWVHTLHVVDASVRICDRENIKGDRRLTIVLAALCHDLGKATNTEFVDGHWRSRGHEKAGESPTLSFLTSVGCPRGIAERVIPLVVRHLAHISCQSDKSIRRLANAIAPATIEDLCFVIEADHSGRPPLPASMPEGASHLLERAAAMGCSEKPVKPLLMGRHLIEMGLKPGPSFGKILAHCLDLQLDGKISSLEGAIGEARKFL